MDIGHSMYGGGGNPGFQGGNLVHGNFAGGPPYGSFSMGQAVTPGAHGQPAGFSGQPAGFSGQPAGFSGPPAGFSGPPAGFGGQPTGAGVLNPNTLAGVPPKPGVGAGTQAFDPHYNTGIWTDNNGYGDDDRFSSNSNNNHISYMSYMPPSNPTGKA